MGSPRSRRDWGEQIPIWTVETLPVYSELKKLAADNPEKMGLWMAKADSVRRESKMLCGFIDSLKLAIVREADGESASLSEINNREDLDAASVVMLNPADGKGGALRERIDIFRENVSRIVVQPQRRSSIESALSTAPFRRKGQSTVSSWEEAKFDNQPVVAAVTLLTKLQNDVRYAEGEALLSIAALSSGKSIVDVAGSDMVANDFSAFVVPEARILMRGTPIGPI